MTEVLGLPNPGLKRTTSFCFLFLRRPPCYLETCYLDRQRDRLTEKRERKRDKARETEREEKERKAKTEKTVGGWGESGLRPSRML